MPWYYVFAWGVPLILTGIPAWQWIMVQHGLGCLLPNEEILLLLVTSFIPIWVVFAFNWFIIIKIVVLLRRIIAAIPEDMDNASKIKRHYKFVTYQTIMFIFAGILCWGIYLFTFKVWNLPNVWLGLYVLLNPLQGFVNLLVYVSPPWLLKCCCNKDNDENTKPIEEEAFANMDKDVLGVEKVIPRPKVGEGDIVFDEDEESCTTDSLTWNNFRLVSERMNFFEGHGQYAIDVVRSRLSSAARHLEAEAVGEGRSEQEGGSLSLVPCLQSLQETPKCKNRI